MRIMWNQRRFRVTVFVEIPQEGEYSLLEIVNQFRKAEYEPKVAQHRGTSSLEGLELPMESSIFPEVIIEAGEITHATGRMGFLINLYGGIYRRPAKCDRTKTQFQVLEAWIARQNAKRLASTEVSETKEEPANLVVSA